MLIVAIHLSLHHPLSDFILRPGLRVRSPDTNASARQLSLGDRVLVAGQRKGIIRFIGQTQFAPGIWYGVELDQAVGKNNGSVAGVRYFECAIGHGIFAPLSRLQRLPPPHGARSATSTPQFVRASTAGLRHASMTGSLYGSAAGNSRGDRPAPRQAWSTTTSPMIGRAVVGRPSLPQELIRALHAAGHTPKEIKDPPVFYLAEGMQVLCAGEMGKFNNLVYVNDLRRSNLRIFCALSSMHASCTDEYPERLTPPTERVSADVKGYIWINGLIGQCARRLQGLSNSCGSLPLLQMTTS